MTTATSGARLLITGGSGFIGSHVVRTLVGSSQASEVRLLVRRTPAGLPDAASVTAREVPGGLADHVALRELCDGVDTVLHLANRIDGTLEECTVVNVDGTRALLRAAAAAGVRRVLYLSTTAVYEDGLHRGAVEDGLPRRPKSPASVTRLRAEEMVRDAGGLVVRPHMVYGAGDRWVVPAMARMVRALPGWVDGGGARMTLIAVDDLARAVAALALARWDTLASGVLHAGHPEPVRARDVLTAAATAVRLPVPREDISYDRAGELLGAARDPRSARMLSLFARDHWYDCSALWRAVGSPPGAGFPDAFARHAPWYRERRHDLVPTGS
ncbi:MULTISPECIES: NAD-dependent epimerase/dehydratase family protein [unclassified Streptomyces]|uniref:NAD-dependent epimerase/dehydratase family protein n=1 Tax=unclassified Streptomyces TaxID=2593676 RepID=UPI002E18630B